MLSTITVSGVSFELPNGHKLFNKISFSLNSKLTGLVGPNGVGKTCLAQLLVGELSPTEGAIRRTASAVYFPQREEPPEISVDAYLASSYAWSIPGEKLLEGVDRASLCSHLSGGQWMRVRLASTIRGQFLILDEPTNDLDREARAILRTFLTDYPHGILLISHDRECLQLCDDILELSNQGLARYGGSWSAYKEEKERERQGLAFELSRAKREREITKGDRLKKIDEQEKRNRRGKASAKKSGLPKIILGMRKRQAQSTTGKIDASTMEQAEGRVRAAYELYQKVKIDPVMYADLAGSEVPSQKLVAEAKDFNVLFSGSWVYPKVLNFSWRGNIRIAIKGKNGSGKSTLLNALMGAPLRTKGEINLGALRTLYLDQRCSSLQDTESIVENIRGSSRMSEGEVRDSLAKFLFTGESVFRKVSSLSGGERLRAALACGLLAEQKPELLVLDEPTNNLDLTNIQFLERLVRQFKGGVIVVSHDETFLKECRIEDELNLYEETDKGSFLK